MVTFLQQFRAARTVPVQLTAMAAAGDAPLVIRPGIQIDGEVAADVPVHLLGEFSGIVRAPLIIVGRHAEVRGRFEAGHVIVEGRVVDGDIFAGRLELRPTSDVTGTAICRELELDEGALFEGQHRRHPDPLAVAGQWANGATVSLGTFGA